MNLTELFDASLQRRADRIGLESMTGGELRTLTFGELEARANRMARELTRAGSRAATGCALHLANRIEFIDLFLACTRLGVVLVPMNILYRERELRHIVADAEPKAVVVEPNSDAPIPTGAAVGRRRR